LSRQFSDLRSTQIKALVASLLLRLFEQTTQKSTLLDYWMQWLGDGTIENGEEAAGSRVIRNEKKMGIGAFTGEALRSGN
jgi:hypothetical protein